MTRLGLEEIREHNDMEREKVGREMKVIERKEHMEPRLLATPGQERNEGEIIQKPTKRARVRDVSEHKTYN